MIGLLIAGIADKAKWIIGGLALCGLVYGAGYFKGSANSDAECRDRAVKATQAQNTQRGKTDAKVQKLDPAGLCVAMGGSVYHDGRCD